MKKIPQCKYSTVIPWYSISGDRRGIFGSIKNTKMKQFDPIIF